MMRVIPLHEAIRMSDDRSDTGRDEPERSLTASFELLRRAQRGDRDALESVCARYLPRLRRWTSGRLPAHARNLLDTDDVIQETLYRAVDKLGDFEIRGEGAFLAYLRQAALNRIRDEVRRVQRRPAADSLDSRLEDSGLSPLEQTIGQHAVDSYESALAQLREDERELIVARIELGCSYDEIAEALERPSADAARMAVSRALVRLAREMGRENE